MSFEFATTGRILFGSGVVRQAAGAAAQMGARILLVTGTNPDRSKTLASALESAARAVVPFRVEGEPTIERIRHGAEYARDERCDVVVAMGGGSVIDAGKALAALLTHAGEPLDYLEVIGRGQPLTRPSAPLIAIPTTAGTGSEVTRNAVLASPELGVKASLRSPHMLPSLAVVDPDLTLDLPPALTASTGLDALTQLIEPYVSTRANLMTDVFCVEGMRRVAEALPVAWERGHDAEARTAMAWGSLLGGLALANAGLGAVHGFAAPIGGRFPAPHGAVCAALLPHVIEINIEALRQRAPKSPALARYAEIARLATGRAHSTAADAARWAAALCRRLAIPGLSTYGVSEADFPALMEGAARASSMKANPIVLTEDEMHEILVRAS